MNTTTDTQHNSLQGYGMEILNIAGRIVSTDRNQDYGHPEDNFGRTGIMWDAILRAANYQPGRGIDARIVGLMMIALKLDREANQPKDDNLIDIAGYAACTAEITRPMIFAVDVNE